jgi:hypothetical protein
MKKAGSIFLLFIFLFNTMGYFIAFKINQEAIRRGMRKDIENGIINSSVSKIVIENSELASVNWIENDEFEYNNERYDLIKKSENSSNIIFYCINDSKESSLFSGMYEHVKNHISGTKSDKSSSSKIVGDNIIKIVHLNSFKFNAPVLDLNQNSSLPYLSNYKFALIKANFQPPELA